MKRLHTFGAYGGFVWTLTTRPRRHDLPRHLPRRKGVGVRPGHRRDQEVRRAGPEGERYVRGISADAEYVYAGLLDKAKLMRITRADGTIKELAQGPSGLVELADHGDRVLATSGRELIDIRKDGTDDRRTTIPGAWLDMIYPAPDGTVYATSGPDGTLYRYRTGDTAFTKVADAPSPGDGTRKMQLLDEHTMLGITGSGGMWWLDLRTGEAELLDLLEAGMEASPEKPQTMLLVPGRAVYIAGHFSMTVRDLRTGEHRRFRVPGEPKGLVRRGDKIYAAIYPSGEIIAIDIGTDEVTSLGFLGHDQQRPADIGYDPLTDKLVVVTSPLGSKLNGAVSVVDPDTGEKDVHVGVLPDQSVLGLAVDPKRGIAYLGGDVVGPGGTPPTRTTAQVAAFDLRTRTVLWRTEPVAGSRTVQDLELHDGLLYTLYKRPAGAWIALEVAGRSIERQGRLSFHGTMTVHRGRVFASTYREGGNAYLLGPETRHLATGLGEEWFQRPRTPLRAGLVEGLGPRRQRPRHDQTRPPLPESDTMKTPLAALAAVLATVLATVLLTTAPAQAATCEPPTVERFGPASVTGAIVGASVHEGKAYVVTRGQKPPVLAELDLSTRKVVRSVTLPDAPATGEPEGAWATAVSGGKVYAGTYPVPDLYSFDLATGEVKHLRSFGRNGGFVWSLAAAPDGHALRRHLPRRPGVGVQARHRRGAQLRRAGRGGALRQGRRAPTRTTSTRACSTRASSWRSTARAGPCASWPRAGGIGVVAEHGDRVLAVSGTTLIDVRKDGTDLRRVPTGAGSLDAIVSTPDGTVYGTTRPTAPSTATVPATRLSPGYADAPSPGDETRRLALTGEGALVGFSGSAACGRSSCRARRPSSST
ncbi:hypothetical protein [Nonomuraea dietziae]|uniref:hypothetical protein n=1 Tax=Nonomuraea dietziae TaxID=65515 RepID=UPI0031D5F075